MKRRPVLTASLLFLAGCTATRLGDDRGANTSGDRPDTLRFAVSDVKGLKTLEANFGAFRDALGRAFDLPVELLPLATPVAAAPALLNERLDLVLAGPSEYLMLRARAKAEPIVSITRPGYHTTVVVRADSGITSLADLRGKTVGMHEVGSTSGHIGATKLMQDAGLAIDREYTVVMVGDDGERAVRDREVAAWLDSSSRTTPVLQAEAARDGELVELDRGEPLPNDIFVASPTLAPTFLEELRATMVAEQQALLAALTASPGNDKYARSELVPADDNDYNGVREMYFKLGIESLIQ